MSNCTITTTITTEPINNNKPVINESPTPMENYTAIVTVTTDSIDHAEEVFRERIGYDEDLGFDYTISCDEPQPEKSTRGIIIDASVIRDQFDSLMEYLDDNDPDDKRILDAYDRIKTMNDSDLNDLISSSDNKYTWELFNDMRDQIFDSVVDATLKTDPS